MNTTWRRSIPIMLNNPPIQFPLFLKSPSQNIYSKIGSSHVGEEDNNIEVGYG